MSFRFFFFRVLPVIYLVVAIIAFFAPGILSLSPQATLIIRILSVVVIAVVIFVKMLFYRCKDCKKWFALVKERSSDIEYSRNASNIAYTCKHCGSKKFKKKTNAFGRT